jgi:hypothetical protein
VYLVGESTILRLTGDPQSGGEIHLVTDSMGGVFGDSWCKDDRGRAFMWGNKPPGLYHLPEDADPEPLTSETLEATDFLEIDYATHRMLLAWDPIERGVRIWQVAWATSTVVAHWFWEERTHRLVKVPPIWQDRYASVAIQPTAVAYLAGDDTRGLLVGCEDGRIRRYDPAARDDDGTAIDSFIVFDLTAGMPPKMAARVTEIEIVLADDQEGCVAELFAGETGEALGPILDQVQLKPGRNCWRVRIKGSHIRLRLRNAATGRWSFEEGSYLIEAVGKVRQRQV